MKAGVSGPGGLATGSSASGWSSASAGTTDRGKSNVSAHSYPGRRIKRSPVVNAVSNHSILKSARNIQLMDSGLEHFMEP